MSRKLSRRASFIETLEHRHLLAIAVTGVPNWVAQGPGPSTNGQVENITNRPVTGAVNALSLDPTNADIIFLGGVNGGVWKTTNATAANPTWTPLTDLFQSPSIAALEMDPTDATHQTLVAGIGATSSFGGVAGSLAGLLRTTDGGATWAQVGRTPLNNRNVSSVGPRGNIILVGVNGGTLPGIYRSTDTGATFQFISGLNNLNLGPCSDLAGDPSNSNRFYAAVQGATGGVFRTDDAGASWTNVTDAAIGALVMAGTSRIELSVSAAAPNPVYLGVVSAGELSGVFRTADMGGTWAAMDLPRTLDVPRTVTSATNTAPIVITTNMGNGARTGDRVRISGVMGNTAANGDFTVTKIDDTNFSLNGTTGNGNYTGGGDYHNAQSIHHGRQGGTHFSILADPGNANLVYVGGDRQDFLGPDSSISADNFSGRLFRGDASIAPGGPNAVPSPQWTPLTHSGTAGDSSPHADSRDSAFDANGNIIQGDDGGIYRRTNPQDNTGNWFSVIGNNLALTEFTDISYDSNSDIILGGAQDTGTPQQNAPGSLTWTDQTQGDGPRTLVDNLSLAGVNQSTRYIGLGRRTFNAANVQVGAGVNVLPAGGLPGFTGFSTYETSTVAPPAGEAARLVIAGNTNAMMMIDVGAVYESNNASIAPNQAAVNWTQVPTGMGFNVATALAVGGRQGGVDNPEILYAGSGNRLFLRTTAGGTLEPTSLLPAGGTGVNDIILDPDDFAHVFAIDSNQVFESTDAGMNWSDITGNLADAALRSIAFIAGPTVDALMVAASTGIFRMISDLSGVWSEFGAGLPNAPVFEIQYSADNNILVAGTLGRGAFTIPDVRDTAFIKSTLTIDGDAVAGQNDDISLSLDPNNPLMLNVFINSATPAGSFQASTFFLIDVNGLGGTDTLTVDFVNGNPITPCGIDYDGGTGANDKLILRNGFFGAETYTATGSGDGTITFASGLQSSTITFSNLSPIDDSVPVFTFTFNAPAGDDIINVADLGAGQRISSGNAGFELIDLLNKGDIRVNASDGNDVINVTPSASVPIIVNGGAQTTIDKLNIAGEGLDYTFNGTTFSSPTKVDVTYSDIETLGLANGIFTGIGAIAPNVEVQNLATLIGQPTIAGVLSALAGSKISPGVGGPGKITSGGLQMFAGATLLLDLNGLTPVTQHDQMVVNGAVSLGGATLDINLGFVAIPGQDIVIIRNDLNDPVAGTFAQGSLATFGTIKFAIDYTFPADPDGFKNDVAMIRFGAALGPDPCNPGGQALFVSATTGNDIIRVIPATGNSRMQVLINGMSEGFFQTGPGNHGLIIVYGQDGNDTITIEMPSRDVLVYGNDGNDTIRTGNNNGILLGGDDNDLLIGGNQDDLLIGGRGADRLEAGNGKDILVAGFSSFEGNTPANQMALCNILKGANLFNPMNVFDDADVDILLGGNGQDRFFLNLTGGVALDISDRSGNELVTDLV